MFLLSDTKKGQRASFTLDEDETKKYLDWCEIITRAFVDKEIEPPGIEFCFEEYAGFSRVTVSYGGRILVLRDGL